MIGRIGVLIFLLTTAFTALGVAKAKDLKIIVQPLDGSNFRISVTFNGDSSGITKLRLPNEWGGQPELYKAITIVKIEPSDAKIADTPDPSIKTITHRPGDSLTVIYELSQDFAGALKNDIRYRPVAGREYIHWIGKTVWVLPEWRAETKVKATIEWNVDKTWTLANSFVTGKNRQKFVTDIEKLGSAIYVGGDFRLISTRASGKPLNLAIRGKWDFEDAELAEMARKVIETERDFFSDNSQDYFLVTLVPIDEGPNALSFGGTGLTDSFALFATPNATVARLRSLLAHEYFHNWNPVRLGKMPEPEQSLYWFSEGFTEYYSYQLLYRSGLLTKQEFVDQSNELVREYYMLTTRNEPNERIVKDFWNDRNVGRLPYLRGMMFAMNLNAEIRRNSGGKHSLDNVMLDMFAASRVSQQAITIASLTETFRKHLKNDPAPLIRRFIVDGETIEPEINALGVGFSRKMIQIRAFELGFDFDKFAKDRVVSGVMTNSSAYDAGLRNGQQRNGGASISFGDTTRAIELKVKENNAEKTIKYLPVAKQSVSIPQFSFK